MRKELWVLSNVCISESYPVLEMIERYESFGKQLTQ